MDYRERIVFSSNFRSTYKDNTVTFSFLTKSSSMMVKNYPSTIFPAQSIHPGLIEPLPSATFMEIYPSILTGSI
jgi:hypothetical protein